MEPNSHDDDDEDDDDAPPSAGMELRPLRGDDPTGFRGDDAPEGDDDGDDGASPTPPRRVSSPAARRVVLRPPQRSSFFAADAGRRRQQQPPSGAAAAGGGGGGGGGDGGDDDDDFSFSSSSPSSSHAVLDDHRNNDARRKRMVLLLLMTLVVGLLGAAVGKRPAALVVGSSVEAGGTAASVSHHDLDGSNSSSSSSSSSSTAKDEAVAHPSAVATSHEGYQPKTTANPFYVLPGTEDAPPLSAASGRPYVPVTNHFQTQNPDSRYSKIWGKFDLVDPDPAWRGRVRPQPANFDGAPNRDVKNADFPGGSWQADAAYMRAFLTQAKLLVDRAIEAVYAEYGVGLVPGAPPLSDEKNAERNLFAPVVPLSNQSADGVARRLIHHVMTGDTFELALGGHSAAAGHGAGFNQSYIIEAGHVLEPVFAHLGVNFRAYNFAQGGMGTLQQSMAGMDLRGKNADWITWDSGMTEKSGEMLNFFFRQALIAGNRAPVLMGGDDRGVGGDFHGIAGAAVAGYDNGGWVPVTDSDEQVKTVPWAAQWLSCSRTATTDCKAHEYTAGCWVDREDYTPTTPQNAVVGGAASWHPGNRIHKRRGRMIAIAILRSMAYAFERWEALGAVSGYPIPEEHWHVTDYYKSIREKATEVPGCFGDIWKIGQKRHLEEIGGEGGEDAVAAVGAVGRKLDDLGFWPGRICNIPMQGRSLWGPRYDPMRSSLLTIMKPNVFGDVDPSIKTNAYVAGPVYQPPDRPAPWTVPPDESEPFAPLIAASRRFLTPEEERDDRRGQLRTVHSKTQRGYRGNREATARALNVSVDSNAITPGLGLQVNWGLQGVCDGSSHHWCDKIGGSSCLMTGSQDNRGNVCFNGFSGWLVLDVKNVKHGFIGARMEAWGGDGANAATDGWTEVNNGGRGNYDKSGRERRLHEEYQERMRQEFVERMKREIDQDVLAESDPTRRRLGGGQSCGLHGDYLFEWAINGKVMGSWTQAQFCEHYTRISYNLDVIKFMDDVSQTGNIELAMRMAPVNGQRGPAMCLTHLYWA